MHLNAFHFVFSNLKRNERFNSKRQMMHNIRCPYFPCAVRKSFDNFSGDWPYHSVTHIHTECNCIQMRILHAPTRDTYFEICIATEYYWMKKKKKLRGNNKTWQQKTITDESDAEPKNDQNYEKRYQKYDIHFVWQKSHFIYSVNQSSAYAYTFAWFWIDNTRENNGE